MDAIRQILLAYTEQEDILLNTGKFNLNVRNVDSVVPLNPTTANLIQNYPSPLKSSPAKSINSFIHGKENQPSPTIRKVAKLGKKEVPKAEWPKKVRKILKLID